MTLENLFYLSQCVAALAIIGSLLFLGLEVRHRNEEGRHRRNEESLQKLRDVELHMARDADQARVWLSGLHDYGSLSATDKVRFSLLAHMALKANESFFLAHRDGRMSREMYKPEELHQADFLPYPGFQAVWMLRKRYFHEAFQRWVDDTIAAATTAGTVPRHYQEEVVSSR